MGGRHAAAVPSGGWRFTDCPTARSPRPVTANPAARMLRAAFPSACASCPQATQQNRAWGLPRLGCDPPAGSADLARERRIYPDDFGTVLACLRACVPATAGPPWNRPQPLSRIARFSLAFCRTFRPGAATVPLAVAVICLTFRSSTTTRPCRAASRRAGWVAKSPRRTRIRPFTARIAPLSPADAPSLSSAVRAAAGVDGGASLHRPWRRCGQAVPRRR